MVLCSALCCNQTRRNTGGKRSIKAACLAVSLRTNPFGVGRSAFYLSGRTVLLSTDVLLKWKQEVGGSGAA